MPIKKSDLYSSLWASCDALRGGMDASQYKDYVLALLFIKYVSDKYAGQRFADIELPRGASFQDMVALKGRPDIGERINKQIVAPLMQANHLSDFPDFNDAGKLGSGKEMVDRLTDLIGIFENPALDFSKHRAGDDDLLGDAYEYLMRHFATESGKSKGQFYTPAEVSRIIAQVLGIREANTSNATTVYDPTCGSGSLLLKVADEARAKPTLFGQEKDSSTAGLARMNMILHDNAQAEITPGNTLTDPKFLDSGQLRTFDYVIANPPFSDKRWRTGLDPASDRFGRFEGFGVPPNKQGDYAYLLHIVRSLKSTGKGACILPHGVLFRGNAEAAIRRNLVRRGYIKGIIGLPANLFYGTGIPACIVVIDKQGAQARKGIFMIDASAGFMKDGPKNRLRARDIHRIVDVFRKAADVPKYARMVPLSEIEKNDYNLNLPRYIDSQPPEDMQDIEGHLKGGIPVADVDALQAYWAVCPDLRNMLFSPRPSRAEPGVRVRYLDLAVDKAAIKSSIYQHPQFTAFLDGMNEHFNAWRKQSAIKLKALAPGGYPKDVIGALSESLLAHYRGKPLIDAYAIYQHLMDYWAETMQDDLYQIAVDGWKAQTHRVIEQKKNKDGKVTKEVDKGWACDLLPKSLVVAHYFAAEQAAVNQLAAGLEATDAELTELEEEHGGDDAAFSGFDKINKAAVKERLDEIADDQTRTSPARNSSQSSSPSPAASQSSSPSPVSSSRRRPGSSVPAPEDDATDETAVLKRWQKLDARKTALKQQLKQAEAALDAAAYAKYPQLAEAEVKTLVVGDKWLASLQTAIGGEVDRVSQRLTQRVKELAERYEAPLPQLTKGVAELQAKVDAHLKKMGFAWA